MFKLKVRSGQNEFYCIEHQHFSNIKQFLVGDKYRMKPVGNQPIQVRRGIAMLREANLEFISAGRPQVQPAPAQSTLPTA